MIGSPTLWTVSLAEDRSLDLTTLLASTQKLQMSSAINYVYPYIEWIVNIPLTYIELGIFVIGQGFQFVFNEPKSQKQISYIFYIDSISYTEASGDVTGPVTASMILSTKFLFADSVKDKGYYGTVPDIITQMFKEELLPSGAIADIKITKGIDSPMKRYRTYQNAQEFIDTRLVDSFRGEKECLTYIFSDLERNLYATHVIAALEELEIYHAFHQGYHDVSTIANLAQDSKIKHTVSMFEAMNVSINENRQLWQISNSGLVMLYRTNTPKRFNENPVFRMIPSMKNDNKEMFPITSKKSKNYFEATKVYIQDDENDYSKAFTAFSFDRNSSLMDALKIQTSVDINLNIKAGHIMKLYPPSYKVRTPFVSSLFEGNWLITEVSHLVQGTRGRTFVTLQASSIRQRNNLSLDSMFYRQE